MATDGGCAPFTQESPRPRHAAAAATTSMPIPPSTDMNSMAPPPASPLVRHVREPPQRGAHTSCHDNGQVVTQSSRHAQKVIEESDPSAALRYADIGTQFGNASVCSTHAAGAAPALPEPITPPTMAHVVSTSPPTCAVVQKARS